MVQLTSKPLVAVAAAPGEAPIRALPVPGGQTVGQIDAVKTAQIQAQAPSTITAQTRTTSTAASRKKGGGVGMLVLGIGGSVGLAYVIANMGGRRR